MKYLRIFAVMLCSFSLPMSLFAQGWERIGDFHGKGVALYGDSLFVGSPEGIKVCDLARGATWNDYGTTDINVVELVKHQNKVLAIEETERREWHLVRSEDGGNTYENLMPLFAEMLERNYPLKYVSNVVQHPSNSAHVYAAVSTDGYAVHYLFESQDFGETWKVKRFDSEWTGDRWEPSLLGPCGISINPYYPEMGYIYGRMIGVDVIRNYYRRSTDGFNSYTGDDYRLVIEDDRPSGFIPSAMAFSPVDKNTVLMYTANGILRSTDGGATWRLVYGEGLKSSGNPDYHTRQGQVIFDKERPQRVYWMESYTLGTPKNTLFYMSDDAGLTWTELEKLENICVYTYDTFSYNQPFMALYNGQLYLSTYNGVYVSGSLLGIDMPRNSNSDDANTAVYDLQGRRLKSIPQRGVFVKDGRKHVVQ